MKKLFLHIGIHKTGTTALQYGLYKNREVLLEHGYLYPNSMCESWAHHHFHLFLSNHPTYKPALGNPSDLLLEIKNSAANNIIISSENFANLSIEQMKQLSSYLTGFDTSIVIYLRRQDEYLQALWLQKAKLGHIKIDFTDWIDNLDESVERQIDYYNYVDKWKSVFPESRILVRPYEVAQFANSDILSDFLKTCNFPEVNQISKPELRNVSPSYKTATILRLAAEVMPENFPKIKASRNYTRAFNLLQEFANKQGWNNEEANMLDIKKRQEILNKYENINHRVANEYLGRDKLFNEPIIVKNELSSLDIDSIPVTEIINVFGLTIWALVEEAYLRDNNLIGSP